MNKSYRKIYKEYYGFDIPKGWEVHHLDMNHENNDPKNLLALPKECHKRLHFRYRTIMIYLAGDKAYRVNDMFTISDFNGCYNEKMAETFVEYAKVCDSLSFYVRLRNDIDFRNAAKEAGRY